MQGLEGIAPIRIKEDSLRKLKKTGLVLDFSEDSPSSRFYDSMFSEDRSIIEPELYKEMKERHTAEGHAYRKMRSIVADLSTRIGLDALVVEIGGGVHQNRSGNAAFVFNNYVPVDISRSSIRRYCEAFGKTGVVADATDLPFADNSVDAILTHTFLEHPLDPERVLLEIVRVLRPGGLVIHNDAWFCRWWQRYGIVGLKRYHTMTFKELWINAMACCSELRLIRIPPIVFARAWRMMFCRNNRKLRYGKLTPNYDLLLGCDEDAASSLDPVEVMRFYALRGVRNLKRLTLWQQLFHRNDFIMLQKSF